MDFICHVIGGTQNNRNIHQEENTMITLTISVPITSVATAVFCGIASNIAYEYIKNRVRNAAKPV